ncbi:MAG: putative molybdenum carrier protein [Verrucomicrobiae bacterium]|nr:putative molybdenum carrier protein [Verrucomicrobiae bacterium]
MKRWADTILLVRLGRLKIVSGGQTGVDRAALDVALQLGLPCGGWCPKGRRAEDGPIDSRYPLRETPTPEYAERTEWNVRDSDGTLVLTRGFPTGGTAFTIEVAAAYRRPCLVVDLLRPTPPAVVWEWIRKERICVLNIAGPRAEGNPGLYEQAKDYLMMLFGAGGRVGARGGT